MARPMARPRLAPEALAALDAGDIEALLAFETGRFGGWRMGPGEGEDEADAEDEDDSDEDEEEEQEYSAPSEEEWKQTQAALKKANNQAKRYRLAAKKAAEGKPSDNEKDVAKAVADTEAKWKPRLVNKAAKAALLAAGASKPDRLIKLIDHDDLDIDDDGEIDGLEESIEELKQDYPELFKAEDDDTRTNGTRRRRPGSPDTNGRRPASKPKSSAERIAGGLAGTSR